MPFLLRYFVFWITSPFIIFFVFLLINFITVNAQSPVFAPAAEDVAQLQILSLKVEKRYQQQIEKLPSQNKKDYVEAYKMRWDNIKETFDKKEIYTAKEAQQYLDKVVEEIVKANPLLQNQDFNCYFSRSGIPNASYIGEGIILFNMGLFDRLDNESQAAFTLCHELAHFYLKHSENSISNYVNRINSDAVKKELKKIKSSEYGRGKKIESLVKGLSFNTRRHSRDNETQADSMALELMRNTRFDVAESLSLLSLLDTIDADTMQTTACLQKTFNAKEYPFQKKWIAKEEGLLGGHAQLKDNEPLEDSLKTHPECKHRIAILQPQVEKYKRASSLKNVIDKPKFEELKNTFRYEIVEYAFTSDNYTRSLYYTLEQLERNPSDPYLTSQVGKILNGMYTAQKAHTLTKYIDFPSPYNASNYNMLLQFVQNLYLENFASISYHFLKHHHPALAYYAPFKSAYNTSIQIAKE
ncbi:MAG: peptidase family [Segetibacter sp.]|nr:peptidase family [Segetibacter sp.]